MAATKQQIDAVAVDVLRKYIEHNHCDWKVFAVDPFELAKMLDIEIEVMSLGNHSAIAYTYTTSNEMGINSVGMRTADASADLSTLKP